MKTVEEELAQIKRELDASDRKLDEIRRSQAKLGHLVVHLTVWGGLGFACFLTKTLVLGDADEFPASVLSAVLLVGAILLYIKAIAGIWSFAQTCYQDHTRAAHTDQAKQKSTE